MKVFLDGLKIEVKTIKKVKGTIDGDTVEMYITDDFRVIWRDDASGMWEQIWHGENMFDAMQHTVVE